MPNLRFQPPMTERSPPSSAAGAVVDPRSGFCRATATFHSLRPSEALPPEVLPTTAAAYAFSFLSSPLPAHPALVDAPTGIAVSYPSFLAAVRSLAGGIWSSLGLRPGDVVLVVSPSRLDVPVLYFALMSIGVVVSPANPVSAAEETAHQVRLSKPKVAFATAEAAAKIPSHLTRVVIGSDAYERLASTGSDLAPPAVAVKQSDTAAVLYSSGTTGKVKAVAIAHRSLIALSCAHHENRKTVAAAALAAGEQPPPSAVTLFTIPPFHVFGFMMLLRSVSMGETAVLMERFELAAALRAVERYGVTLMPAAPPVLVAMIKSEEARRCDLSSLLVMGVGGAPLGREVAESFAALFPNVEIVQGYGLTESSGSAASTVGPEETKAYGSVGKLASHLQAKIVDPDTGKALGPGQRGELWLRGPTIMKGYVGDDEATVSAIDSEGWLRTGDVCYFNEHGFLYIVDRLKELIKYKGYQVPPAELENILQSYPEISDAAVIPYPDEEAGQLPMAFVVRKPGAKLTEQQVMDYVAKQVAPYKKIRRVAFVDAIPKSPAGKILRRELVQQALSMGASKL